MNLGCLGISATHFVLNCSFCLAKKFSGQRISQDLADKPDLRWNKEDHAFTKSVEKCLKHYQWLGKHCFEKGLWRYSIVQKFHLTAHMPSTARWMNPGALSLSCSIPEHVYRISKHALIRKWCRGAEPLIWPPAVCIAPPLPSFPLRCWPV